ncbi:unnamed protein product [Adineta ricciae]|uniref:RING-type domain-containing protein n=1 Tax=Adineta ricciae TaxID=249248 RepID=A0A813SV42_ADIRI|nr:unnamed protein product [Adineta ricciae]
MAVVGSQRESICLSQDDVVYADQQSTSALKCPICQRIFSDPVITQCSHTFCRRCISNTVQCPFDQQIVQSFVSNQIIAEQIDALLVWCKYAFKKFPMSSNDTKNERDEYGCPVKIALKRKKEHEDECPYRFVSCPNACSLNNLRQKKIFRICITIFILAQTDKRQQPM